MSPRAQHDLVALDFPDAMDIGTIHLNASGHHIAAAFDRAAAIATAEPFAPAPIVELPIISCTNAAGRLRNNLVTQDIRSVEGPRYCGAKADLPMASAFAASSLAGPTGRVDHDANMSQPGHMAVQQAHENG